MEAARKTITVVVVDIEDSFIQTYSADEMNLLMDVLEEYQSKVQSAITPYKGRVAYAIGDSMLLFFAGENHSERGVRAALDIEAMLGDWSSSEKDPHIKEIRPCLGIHTGEAIVGTTAAGLTIIGDALTLGVTYAHFAPVREIRIANTTYQAVKDIVEVTEQIENVRGTKIKTYVLLGMKEY